MLSLFGPLSCFESFLIGQVLKICSQSSIQKRIGDSASQSGSALEDPGAEIRSDDRRNRHDKNRLSSEALNFAVHSGSRDDDIGVKILCCGAH